MKRRDFLKGIAAASTGIAISSGIGPMLPKVQAAAKADFGEVKSVKVYCVSETSWFDNATLGKDIKDAGGINTNQYDVSYTKDNLGGYAALIEVEALDGKKTTYLLDSGWNTEWVDYVFAKDGIDTMLKNKDINTIFISHDHIDHYFGIESTLKHQPDITMYFPGTAMKKSFELLKGADFSKTPGCPEELSAPYWQANRHRDEQALQSAGRPGACVLRCPGHLASRGENTLYAKVKGKGYITITGCCHPGILTLINYARRNFKDGDKNYGLYGGLHISVFENWDPKFDDLIAGMKNYNLSMIGCNHCTGWIWAEKALAAGLPIIKGTDKNKSYSKVGTLAKANTSNLYIGNGDSVIFG